MKALDTLCFLLKLQAILLTDHLLMKWREVEQVLNCFFLKVISAYIGVQAISHQAV